MKGGTESSYVIGIDEVGRGALAGPVVVVAVLVPARRGAWLEDRTVRRLGPLKDSKKLAPARREAWAAHFRKSGGAVRFAAARIYPRGIERMNISNAANRAAYRAVEALARTHGFDPMRMRIYLDGGLFLKDRAMQKRSFPHARTVVKGDETIPAVSAASIIAKVARDGFMVRLAARHPGYAFEVHKGYGTAMHRAALRKQGPCAAHRLTFLPGKPMIDG